MKPRQYKRRSRYLNATATAERLPAGTSYKQTHPDADQTTVLTCETCAHEVKIHANGGAFKRALVCTECSATGALVVSARAPDGLPCVVVMVGANEGAPKVEIYPLPELDRVLAQHGSA